MSVARVRPSRAVGATIAPPSKSYTHRALIAGHLSGRAFRVDRPLDADDTRATARGLTELGTPVRFARETWIVRPGRRRDRAARIDCGESGTTLRFLIALAARSGLPTSLRGRGRLMSRPLDDLLRALQELGASYRWSPKRDRLTVRGPIHGGTVVLDASTSSQFASALLHVLPTVDGDSRIRLEGRIVSAPYIEATLALLRHGGIRVERRGRTFHVPGGQRYRGRAFRPPGDASSAAYLWSAAALTDGEVRVEGLDDRWPQADRAILPLLRATGAEVDSRRDHVTVRGRASVPFRVDLSDSPDLYPLAGVLAAAIPGRSVLEGAEHVAQKESDRRSGTRALVRAFGARAEAGPRGLVIQGIDRLRAIDLRELTDHRMVMSAAVGALAADARSNIGDAGSVKKSFPGFWTELARLSEGSGS